MGKLVKISTALTAMVCFFAFVGCSDTDNELTNSENITQNPENSKPDEPNLGDHTHVWGEEYVVNGDGTQQDLRGVRRSF